MSLGCIADDYTGASDLANTLTRCGLRTVQTIGVPSGDLGAARSRCGGGVAEEPVDRGWRLAVTRSRAAEKWLRGRGAAHVLFKICSTFDSTDAGNIGPVMDALRADSGDAIVLVTPAFPETGRTVYQGNLFVGSVPLNESPLKDHPLNPMHDSNLVRVLARQSRTKVGLVGLADVARGPDAVRARLADLAGKGFGAAIIGCGFRARSRNHRRGRARSSRLRRRLRHRPRAGPCAGRPRAGSNSNVPNAVSEAPVGGPAACLAGSCSQATLQQIAKAEQAMPVLHLDPDQVVAGKDEAQRALAWARERLGKGPVLIASSSTPDQVAALQARHGRDAAGHAIEQAMADIAEGLVQSGRAAAGGRRRRNLRRGGGSARDSRLSGRRGNRRRRAGAARHRRETWRDAAGAEVRQFRRPGVLLRRPQLMR